MKSAAKVGALLVVFVILVLGSYAILGRSVLSRHRKTYFVSMTDAGGLLVGTRVLMAGVQIGTVDKIALAGPHQAQLTIHLNDGTKVPEGSEAVIQGSLIGLGDTPLEIVAPAVTGGELPEESTLPGRKAGPLDSMLPDGGRGLYSNVNQTLGAVQKLLQDQRLQTDLKKVLETTNTTLQASQATMARFNALAARTDDLLARNEGNLDAMVKATKNTIEQVRYTAGTLADFVRKGKLQNGTTAILDKAVRIEAQASDLIAALNKTASDPRLRANLDRTAQNVADTTDRGPGIADNAKKITSNMAEITERAKPLPDQLNDVAKKASQLEDRLNALLDRFSGVKPPSAQGLRALSTELDVIRQTKPGHWRTDFNGTLPTHDGFVTFGIYDAFEKDKLNLQMGRYAAPTLAYRYGVYASKPAIGVDYQFSRNLGIRTDLWDINSPEFDARFRYDFGGGLIGWAGFDRILSGSYPTFGLGIRK